MNADMVMKSFSLEDFCMFLQSLAAADLNDNWPVAAEVLGILRRMTVRGWAGKKSLQCPSTAANAHQL